MHRVVIVGGGFGGLNAAVALRKGPVSVTLVDRRNFHLFQPLLYQVATGGLSPANIATPLRGVLRKQRNCEVVLAEVKGFDLKNRRVELSDGWLEYDTLVVAAGARHSYFGNDQWEPFAPGLKTIEDATEIRRRVLTAFEEAERCDDPVTRTRWLTFVIVGGGPTGVELAGALGEVARHCLKRDFRKIDPGEARIILIENSPRVLNSFSEKLAAKATAALGRLGVMVKPESTVTSVDTTGVTLKTAQGTEKIDAATVLWGAGTKASPLATMLATATGGTVDRSGRVEVSADLTLPGSPEVFVIGDMALLKQADGRGLPGVAPVAIQQGRYVSRVILSRLSGRNEEPFRYRDRGSLATIGRKAAIADFGRWEFGGFFAWVLWLVIHLMNLVQFQNRILVLIQWGWNYFTYNRSARLITEVRKSQQDS